MRHLSPAELVDLAEGTLAPPRAGHAERCDSCRAAADALRATLGTVVTAREEIPEPSPLYWEHLSRRIDAAVAAPAPNRDGWMAALRRYAPLGAFAVIVAAVLTITVARMQPSPGDRALVVRDAGRPAAISTDDPADPSLDTTTAEVWDVLTSAAADVEWDEAHDAGMAIHPAAIDRAVQELRPDELTELARLLQQELKRSSD